MNYETCLEVTGLRNQLGLMDDYVHRYRHSRSGVEAMPMQDYLRFWFEAKSKYLLNLFDNRLIIEKPIEYVQPTYEIQKAINDKILHTPEWESKIASKIRTILEYMLYDGVPYTKVFSSHIEEDECYTEINSLLRISHVFSSNHIGRSIALKSSAYNHFPKTIKFDSQTRPFKFLRTLSSICEPVCKQMNPALFNDEFFRSLNDSIEEFRIIHSRCLNTKTLKGTLCLSIHPLDYITMSDNGYGWSSCMQWISTPCDYRVGTLEMMNSPCVVVAYLRGAETWNPMLDDREWTWTNKKWRQLFIVHPNVIAGIKGYPYNSVPLAEMVIKELTSMCENHGFSSYGEIIDTKVDSSLADDKIIRFITDAMYNDTESNDRLQTIAKTIDNSLWDDESALSVYLNYSGTTACMHCGKDMDISADNGDSCNSIFCFECDPLPKCSSCGAPIFDEQDCFQSGDEIFCESCFDYCDVCDEPFAYKPNENSVISFIFKAKEQWTLRRILVCQNCMEVARPDLVEVDLDKECPDLDHSGLALVARPTLNPEIMEALRNQCYGSSDSLDLVDFSVEQKS